MTAIVVATRSPHKLREIRELVSPPLGEWMVDLGEVGVEASSEEDGIEVFSTFEENALAKARYFLKRSGQPVLADDSGLCVDALDGAPGPFSKRFSGRDDLDGTDLDDANNRHLLDALKGVDAVARGAHYVCVLALVTPDGREDVYRGQVDGVILTAPHGEGGFGYDPLFFLPSLDATFGEVPQEVKNRLSHRARAVQAALPRLVEIASIPTSSAPAAR